MNNYLMLMFCLMLHCFHVVSVSQDSKNASVNPSGAIRCLPEQSSILLHLKGEFSFDQNPNPDLECYPKMKYWKAGEDCCEWDGVTCDAATGQVAGLDLSMSCLSGSLLSNSSLFRLRRLQRLNLAYNDFLWSQMPPAFANLSRLTHLNLSHSMFSGSVPYHIVWLTNLVSIDLSNYLLDGREYLSHLKMSVIANNMTNLKRLRLDHVNLSSSVPQSFANLSSLRSLSLYSCDLRGEFPRNIFQLPKIEIVDVSENRELTGSLPEFKFRSNLKSLILFQTNFSGILPESIENLKSLNTLDLHFCKFSGTIPFSLGNLSLLTDLQLSYNNFNGQLPSTLGNLSQLTSLILIGSGISGQLPSTLGNLSQLTSLILIDSGISGQLPSTLGNLVKLTELILLSTYGGFTGELPSSFGNLKQLKNDNELSGQIPWVANLTQLKVLDLSHNSLIGPIPSSLFTLHYLGGVDLSSNLFSGPLTIPNVSSSQLTNLYLSENNFSGQIPWVANLTQLKVLDLSHNSLIGPIPSSLFTLHYLGGVDLSSNLFSGPLTIPNVSSSQLKNLHLSENKLNGEIPRSISQLKNLRQLSLESNNLSGILELDIFSELHSLRSLGISGNNISLTSVGPNTTLPKFQSLSLSSCNITEFPDFLKTQDELAHLEMSHNQIVGKIPKWFFRNGIESLISLNLSHNSIGNWEQDLLVLPWKNLVFLDLRSNALQGSLAVPPFSTKYLFISENNLSGTIHKLYCNLTNLVVLDLSNNNLSGTIPECLLSSTASLLVLNVRRNNFSGTIPQILSEGSKLSTMDLSQNQLQGMVPESLIKCRELEILNLGDNQISDTFPFWLQNLPRLQVLVLRSNKFSGPIWHPQRTVGFMKLRIIDLSFNNFTGSLASQYFNNWSAVSNAAISSNEQGLYMQTDDRGYYQDSVTVMNKGSEMVLVKILTIFTSIDLSYNNLSGEIPKSIGDLQSLIVLNLSGNSFEGHIPTSFGKSIALESLDLSNNKLSGRIPQELATLSFLQCLNLSHNDLTGLIPQGRHFDTFPNSSFEGNSDLCGFPLSKKCHVTSNDSPDLDQSLEAESENGFGWKSVLIGYGCGFAVGLIGGYVLFSKKPSLFIKIYGREKRR